jgi:uncharacterized iron-regulated membrane protein
MKVNTRKLLFDLHLYAGLAFGVVLLSTSLTGAVLLFRTELDAWSNPHLFRVQPGKSILPIDELVAHVRAAHPQGKISYIDLSGDPSRSAMFRFRGRDEVYLDPCTGAVLGQRNKNDTLLYKVERLHRYLLLRGTTGEYIGEIITGGSALGLIFLLGSGVYLWVPKSRATLKAAFTLNRKFKGRAWNVNLHKVLGVYGGIVLFISAYTGLPIAFQWFKQAFYYSVTLSPAPLEEPKSIAPADGANQISAETAWQTGLRAVGDYQSAQLYFPETLTEPFEIFIVARDAPHANAGTTLFVDAYSGDVLRSQPYNKKSAGERFFLLSRPLHNGKVGGLVGRLMMLGGLLCLMGLVVTGAWLYYRRKIAPPVRAARPAVPSPAKPLSTSPART